jgi:hypothetical protein
MAPEDIAAYRAMTPNSDSSVLWSYPAGSRQFKILSVRVHHPGWSDEKVIDEVGRWVRDGMKPEELYEL